MLYIFHKAPGSAFSATFNTSLNMLYGSDAFLAGNLLAASFSSAIVKGGGGLSASRYGSKGIETQFLSRAGKSAITISRSHPRGSAPVGYPSIFFITTLYASLHGSVSTDSQSCCHARFCCLHSHHLTELFAGHPVRGSGVVPRDSSMLCSLVSPSFCQTCSLKYCCSIRPPVYWPLPSGTCRQGITSSKVAVKFLLKMLPPLGEGLSVLLLPLSSF